MMNGGTVIDAGSGIAGSHELWQTVERRGVQNIAIVGDAFVPAGGIEENAGAYDLST